MADVVLLHGWGMNKGIWQLQKDALEAQSDHTIHTLNLPGFGGNQFSDAVYDLDCVARQLATDIADQSVLVAWSLSGLIALKIAALFPHKVKKIVLVASTPFFASSEQWRGIDDKVLDTFMAQLSTNHPKTVERFLAIQAMGSEHAKQDIKQIKALLAEYPAAQEIALSGGLAILKNEDLRDLFAQLPLPISGIFGRLDSLVPVKAVAKMQQLNPQFEADILAKASHAPFISHPQEFTNLLLSHIES
ncbi:pimeloyl-ACP methyl ester esterase BioH [Pseudoalteromonas spongiae]|uniref:Pimeloyl-[acyl-carrier protein] methyl ester esterase n=1 Tax=Pseudoalteromonas spongiae TaxID=298657 RepID=A0ABU8EUJ4_9GAMM